MALVKCPECKRNISETSIRCPHCDFVLNDKVVVEQKIPEKKYKTHQNAHIKRFLEFLHFNWFFDFLNNIADGLSNIPLIGTVLSLLFKVVVGIVVLAINFCVFYAIISGLSYVSPLLATEVILIGFTINMYFYAYGSKMSYCFWIALVMTILFPIVMALA